MIHPEAIGGAQHSVLAQSGPFATKHGFYLARGTALALQLGHRRSVDFDWFTERRVDPMSLAQELRDEGLPFTTGAVDRGTLQGRVGDVRTSFFEYRYPLLQAVIPWPSYGIVLASLDDLACMKLNAVAQRSSKKDFIDVYTLIKKYASLPDLISLYERKYEAADIGHLLYALVYFDPAEDDRAPVLLWDLDWEEIKEALRRWTKDVAG